jgi:hypothetical protein
MHSIFEPMIERSDESLRAQFLPLRHKRQSVVRFSQFADWTQLILSQTKRNSYSRNVVRCTEKKVQGVRIRPENFIKLRVTIPMRWGASSGLLSAVSKITYLKQDILRGHECSGRLRVILIILRDTPSAKKCQFDLKAGIIVIR